MAYDRPIYTTYTFPAATLSAAATIGKFQGPAGRTGRVDDISYRVTTGVTVAASEVNIGATANDTGNAVCSVEVASAGATGAATADEVGKSDSNRLTADTTINVATDGACTAGAADLFITVAWY